MSHGLTMTPEDLARLGLRVDYRTGKAVRIGTTPPVERPATTAHTSPTAGVNAASSPRVVRAPGVRPVSVEIACDATARQYGAEVVKFSQAQRSQQTRGIADRLYWLVRDMAAVWFECKSPRDKLTASQFAFLDHAWQCEEIAGCGSVEDLDALLAATVGMGKGVAATLGRQQVTTWAAKGFRPEPLTRAERRRLAHA